MPDDEVGVRELYRAMRQQLGTVRATYLLAKFYVKEGFRRRE